MDKNTCETILNKVINNEIDVEMLVKWLLQKEDSLNNEAFNDVVSNVNRTDFVVYFVQFIHQVESLKTTARNEITSSTDNFQHRTERKENPSVENVTARSPLQLGAYLSNASPNRRRSGESARRRINPTAIKTSPAIKQTPNSFDFQKDTHDTSAQCDPRTYLLEERNKLISRSKMDRNNYYGAPVVPLATEQINVDPALVDNKRVLEHLARIFVEMLKNNLVLNIASEIYFLVSLLVAKYCSENLSEEHVLKKPHNVVYFSVCSLKLLTDYLKHYGCCIIRLLSENSRIKSFDLNFSKQLALMASNIIIEEENVEDEEHTVCFDSDTDNRHNFPDGQSFQTFRKQRDAFYETLRSWKLNHMCPNFKSNVAGIFAASGCSTNHMHLCRLLTQQMVSERGQEEGGSSPQTPPRHIASLLDSEKLNQLRKRLTTNADCSVGSSSDFYRAFAEAAPHPFKEHLKNCLAEYVLEKMPLFQKEENNGKGLVEEIRRLKLVCSLLGYLEALPYKNEKAIPEKLLANYMKLREMSPLKLNLTNLLSKAKLLVTVPWITSYLIELDYIILRTKSCMKTLEMLVSFYKSCTGTMFDAVLIQFTLGQLFESPNFPRQLFFTNSSSCDDSLRWSSRNESVFGCSVPLTAFCPHLLQLRGLLLNGSRQKATQRHITPVSERAAPQRRLEARLRDAFLSGRPSAERQLVALAAERVAARGGSEAEAAARAAACAASLLSGPSAPHLVRAYELGARAACRLRLGRSPDRAPPAPARPAAPPADGPSAATLLWEIQRVARRLVEHKDAHDFASLSHLVTRGLVARNATNDLMATTICTAFLDICLLIVTHRPHALNIKWACDVIAMSPKTVCNNLFNERNLRMLSRSEDVSQTWLTLAAFVAELSDRKLTEMEAQCTAFYRLERTPHQLHIFSLFLKEFASKSAANSSGGLLLNFLGDFCADL